MNLFKIRNVRALMIFVIDFILCISIFSLIYHYRVNSSPNFYNTELWLITITLIASLFFSGTYIKGDGSAKPSLPINTFFISLVGGFICILWVYILGPLKFNEYFGRGILPFGTIIFGVVATLNRFFINRIYHSQEKNAELLYIGYSKSADNFFNELKNHSEIGSVCHVTDKDINVDNSRVTHESPNSIHRLLRKQWNGIIIDPKHHSSKVETKQLIQTRLSGTPVMSISDYYEKFWFMVPIDDIGDDWFLRSQGFSMLSNPVSNRIKRLIDIVLGIVLLILSAPIILICGLLIKLSSRGPVFFSQNRVGQQGAPFKIYKLRTMHVNAEANGAQWASENDSRITTVGNFLRKSRLDELPQCWNVLKGEMSFIGPRPERPEFTKDLSKNIPYYDLRHIVKPGISGWAQVIYPYGASNKDAIKKLQYELYYIKNQSLLFDINIMLRTLMTIFQRSGR